MFCVICKSEYETFTSVFAEYPWIDGKKHKGEMCHCCSCVPKMYEYDEKNEEIIVYEEFDPKRIKTVEELMEEGFDKKESQISIKAVKALVRKMK